MPAPIMPSPMKPIFIVSSDLQFAVRGRYPA
jgi:hypothetical protein